MHRSKRWKIQSISIVENDAVKAQTLCFQFTVNFPNWMSPRTETAIRTLLLPRLRLAARRRVRQLVDWIENSLNERPRNERLGGTISNQSAVPVFWEWNHRAFWLRLGCGFCPVLLDSAEVSC